MGVLMVFLHIYGRLIKGERDDRRVGWSLR